MKVFLTLLLHLTAAREKKEQQCCGPGQSDAGLVSAEISAIQLESDMATAGDQWFESPAVPLRQKALMEPCILGKVKNSYFTGRLH